MTVDVNAPYRQRVSQALQDDSLRTALDRATARLSERRAEAVAAIDSARLRDEARAIRQSAIEDLPRLLEQLESNLIGNGCAVHWARDAAEATSIVLEIARRNEVLHVVKSKSMVTEEIGLNEALEENGIEVVETDLGEYIIQLANEPPSHIIAPVIHKRVEDISELFHRELGMPPTDDPAEMCGAARGILRAEFLRADIGISGCNFAIAETGTICVITNEGNGRMVTSMPRVYVAVAGIEKVVSTAEEAILLWQAASRNATGQDVSVYFSMSSGPRHPGHADGPEEMHVVLLDNGRSRMLERAYGDAALCIRCGACINVCPVYREIGGHAYGRTPYNGPIGAVITPLLADDPTTVRDLPFASSLCGACRDVCPVKIDLPRLLLDLRSDMTTQGASPKLERMAIRAYARSMERPACYRLLQRLARLVGQLPLRLPFMKDWTRTRDLPPLASKSFLETWGEE
ncbi:MAG: (Fe-S)-binding protein [Gemmatimonas sp. SG8_38_2]|nr:MAG: (Fe-S)-binding protein [Gemmatimonas sp. SG8_38_2]